MLLSQTTLFSRFLSSCLSSALQRGLRSPRPSSRPRSSSRERVARWQQRFELSIGTRCLTTFGTGSRLTSTSSSSACCAPSPSTSRSARCSPWRASTRTCSSTTPRSGSSSTRGKQLFCSPALPPSASRSSPTLPESSPAFSLRARLLPAPCLVWRSTFTSRLLAKTTSPTAMPSDSRNAPRYPCCAASSLHDETNTKRRNRYLSRAYNMVFFLVGPLLGLAGFGAGGIVAGERTKALHVHSTFTDKRVVLAHWLPPCSFSSDTSLSAVSLPSSKVRPWADTAALYWGVFSVSYETLSLFPRPTTVLSWLCKVNFVQEGLGQTLPTSESTLPGQSCAISCRSRRLRIRIRSTWPNLCSLSGDGMRRGKGKVVQGGLKDLESCQSATKVGNLSADRT
ncbi:uncharacterized protein J3D65DRAFT_656572, partial [Phyllosticta citribraziliensis]